MAQNPQIVSCPLNWEFIPSLEYAAALTAHKDTELLHIDFSEVQFVRPFGILWIAEAIRDVVRYRKERGLKTQASGLSTGKALTFLMHVGFFSYTGLKFGKAIGEANSNNNYLPITLIEKSRFSETDDLIEQIQRYAGDLTRVVMGLSNGTPIPNHPVRYCLREVIRNVFEHSESPECLLMAQWYDRRELEIAILDRGVGIRRSLEKKFAVADDGEALALALQPGISRANLDSEDAVNSGFGLYVISELGRRSGSFAIVSGSDSLHIKASGAAHKAVTFSGTVIRLVLQKPKGQDPAQLIKAIIEEGEEISRSKKGKGASKWSKEL